MFKKTRGTPRNSFFFDNVHELRIEKESEKDKKVRFRDCW